MSDFVNEGWGIYIAVITIISIVACFVLLYKLSTKRVPGSTVQTMGHKWDGDLEEFNNPLPMWWMWLFVITLIFGALYIVLYPGLGAYAGVLGWSSQGQYENEQKKAAERFGPVFEKYRAMDVRAVAANPEAKEIGQRLFLTYCAGCHASDAGGTKGFPNLRDGDWLYGGEPDNIKTSILEGRSGLMPPLGAALGDEGTKDVAHFVLSLAGKTHDSLRASRGKELFTANCVACHGPEGKGNQALGAPNLTDDVWLYGGGESTIIETVTKGRNGHMPSHKNFLDEAKVHMLAAYVYGLSMKSAP